MKNKLLIILLIIQSICVLQAQQLAFPTAEGYGKYVTGGRGGTVYEVTNLNSSGTGSFGAAISASGARTIVFRVSGTIVGNYSIKNDNLTIAGQTAPGDGICIRGNLSTEKGNNIIIRYIRIRFDPDYGSDDAIGGRYSSNIIFDHVSASWSTDETMTLYHNVNTTVQWCMISEACEKFEDGVGIGHRFGGIWGNNPGTWHHNLIANNDSRNPRWASGCGFNDYRNNVIYNWGYQSAYGGEAVQVGMETLYSFSTLNLVANYYKAGPATGSGVKYRIVEPSERSTTDQGSWYISDNYVDGYPSVTSNNWTGVSGSEYIKLTTPWQAMPINQETATDAYTSVLAKAGCSFPIRDTVDTRIVHEASTGTSTYGTNGIISYPSDVGGWPTLNSTTAPIDTDHDGMPDSWETANGLNLNDATDRNGIGEGGYTNLEVYLYKLVGEGGQVTGVSLTPTTGTVGINSTLQIYTLIAPYSASNQNVIWSSSNTAIATVSSTGLVTGVAEGSATITATTEDGGFTAQSTVTVNYISVTGIKTSLTTLSVNVGATGQLTASVLPTNAVNQSLSWSSSNTAVATVNSSGLVSGLAVGTSTITTTSAEGGYIAQCTVSVIPAVIYQAENYTSQSGNTVVTTYAGYTGSGLVDMGSNGAWIEWNNIDGGSGGSTSLIFRYANGGTTNRQCDISVNGISVGNLSFSITGGWTMWTTQTITANLNTGNNTVRVTVNTTNGGPNFDYVNVSPLMTALKSVSDSNIKCYPNLVDKILNIDFTNENVGDASITIYSLNGESVYSTTRNISLNKSISLELNNLSSGIYFCSIRNRDRITKLKFIKK